MIILNRLKIESMLGINFSILILYHDEISSQIIQLHILW